MDRVSSGQVFGGQSGVGTGFWWTEWHRDRFLVDRVASGHVFGGQSGIGTGFW